MKNRNDFMQFERYKEELALIVRQNPYEQELYSVLMYVLRSCMMQSGISYRDVSADRKAKRIHTGNLMSDNRFPDFVILDKKYSVLKEADGNNPYQSGIYGAVEIKWLGKSLDSPKYIEHLRGYLAYFKKVIYTNGLEWRFYGWNRDGTVATTLCDSKEIPEPSMRFILGIMNQVKKDDRPIVWRDDPDWQETDTGKKNEGGSWNQLLEYLKTIQWK